MVCYPRRRRGTPAAAAIREFTDGATMDAAVDVGEYVKLMGAGGHGMIALLECVGAGPVYRFRSPMDFRNSNQGAELTGVLAFAILGTATLPTWASSTPGDANVGGPRLAGSGCVVLNGIADQAEAFGVVSIKARIHLLTYTTTTNDHFGVGLNRKSVATKVWMAGGGKAAGGFANFANSDETTINGLTPSFNSAFASTLASGDNVTVQTRAAQYSSTGVQLTGSCVSGSKAGLSGTHNDSTSEIVGVTDLRPCFSRVNQVVHLNVLEFYNG
jgi:hypothetical protein